MILLLNNNTAVRFRWFFATDVLRSSLDILFLANSDMFKLFCTALMLAFAPYLHFTYLNNTCSLQLSFLICPHRKFILVMCFTPTLIGILPFNLSLYARYAQNLRYATLKMERFNLALTLTFFLPRMIYCYLCRLSYVNLISTSTIYLKAYL